MQLTNAVAGTGARDRTDDRARGSTCGKVVASTSAVQRSVIVALGCGLTAFSAACAGPRFPGAELLSASAGRPSQSHDLPASYRPLHKGAIQLGTGVYQREDEDLIVPDTPALILRRTYLSGYRQLREFGVGTTHNGELYIVGDAVEFQWSQLILPTGTRITFDRTSPGTTHENAMYEHRSSPSEWQGARLGWIGTAWALRRSDGSLMLFQPCGVGSFRICSILQERDADGHTIYYRRDQSGRLLKIESARDRWIAFDYDAKNLIRRAYAHAGSEVRYEYDDRGRLVHVTSSEGIERRYEYTDRDAMATIFDPGTRIENTFNDDGRCTRQVNHFPDSAEPFVFNFSYLVENGAVIEGVSKRSDGTWKRFEYGRSRYVTAESWGRDGLQPATFTYERDPVTNAITELTLTCPDRTGTPVRHSSRVYGNEEWIKADLLRTNCSWRAER